MLDLSEDDVATLADNALELLLARKFDQAQMLFELLLALGERVIPPWALCYAICLNELGHSERAASVCALVDLELAALPPGSDEARALAPLYAHAKQRLPGGKLDTSVLPRLSKPRGEKKR